MSPIRSIRSIRSIRPIPPIPPMPPMPSFSSTFDRFSLDINWKETPEAHIFKADLPAMRKEEVKVEVLDDQVLQISGEWNVKKKVENDTWHHVESSAGKFTRRFRLPDNAKMEHIKASMENGVLTVNVPKEGTNEHDVKATEISG